MVNFINSQDLIRLLHLFEYIAEHAVKICLMVDGFASFVCGKVRGWLLWSPHLTIAGCYGPYISQCLVAMVPTSHNVCGHITLTDHSLQISWTSAIVYKSNNIHILNCMSPKTTSKGEPPTLVLATHPLPKSHVLK